MGAQSKQKSKLEPQVKKHLVWADHVAEICQSNRFQICYHMSEEAFNHLVEILCPRVTSSKKMSEVCCGQHFIGPELVVASGLRFMGVELVKSITDIFQLTIPPTYRIIWGIS